MARTRAGNPPAADRSRADVNYLLAHGWRREDDTLDLPDDRHVSEVEDEEDNEEVWRTLHWSHAQPAPQGSRFSLAEGMVVDMESDVAIHIWLAATYCDAMAPLGPYTATRAARWLKKAVARGDIPGDTMPFGPLHWAAVQAVYDAQVTTQPAPPESADADGNMR